MTRYSLLLLLMLIYLFSYGQSDFHSLMDRGQAELEAGNLISARYSLMKAVEQLPEKTSPEDKAVLYNNLGITYYNAGSYKTGIDYYLTAVKYHRESKIDTLLAGALYNLGLSYNNLGLSGHAMKVLLQSARIFEKKDKMQQLSAVWSAVGSVCRDLRNFPKAIYYHRKALSIRQEIKSDKGIYESYQNIGSVYLEWKHYSKAKHFLFEALKRKRKVKKSNIVTTISSLGRLYLELGQPDKAYPFLQKAYEMRLEAGNSTKAAESLSYLATYYFSSEDVEKALSLFRRVENTATSRKNWQLLAEALEGEIKILESLKDSSQLIKKYPELLITREKAATDSNRKEVDRLEILYDTERNKRTIERQQLNNSRLKIFLSFSGLLVLTIGTAWYRLRQSKKQIEQKNKELTQQKEEITNLHQELSHRTKNYFRMLSGILKFDRKKAKHEEALNLLNDNIRRLDAMSLIQSHLLDDSTKHNKNVAIESYFSKLIEELLLNLFPNGSNVKIIYNLEELYIDYDKALRLAIILNELICNAIKYGLSGNTEPKLKISVQCHDALLVMIVRDNGTGMPDHLNKPWEHKGLGHIAKLVHYLDGTLAYGNDNGCVAKVSIGV